MSDENKQLTVAELLARAGRDTTVGKEGKDGREPRRRRRRSLEEGGISVAELTGSIPAVKEKPAESRHSSVPIDAPAAPAQPVKEAKPTAPAEPAEAPSTPKLATEKAPAKGPTPATDETVVFDKVRDTPATPDPVKAEDKVAEKPVAAAAPAAKPTPATSETGEIPAVTAPTREQPTAAVEVADDRDVADVDKQHDEVEEKTSVLGVILMTLIGVVLGAVVFKGFEMLWENLSRPVVAGLALLVTVLMVVVVKALRTANDGLSMFMAALVGVVMTFGPLAVVLI